MWCQQTAVLADALLIVPLLFTQYFFKLLSRDLASFANDEKSICEYDLTSTEALRNAQCLDDCLELLQQLKPLYQLVGQAKPL